VTLVPADGPSVKGTLFLSVVSDIRKLVDTCAISRDELERALPDEALVWVDQEILRDQWYPVRAFGRLVDFVWEHQGDREPEFMVRAGRTSAEEMVRAGVYSALQSRAQNWGGNIIHVMTTVSGALYNFMEWRPVLTSDPRLFSLEVTEATEWPECLRLATEGFIQFLAERAAEGRPVQVRSERATPDRIVFFVEVLRPS
jgi:hypothetical protein